MEANPSLSRKDAIVQFSIGATDQLFEEMTGESLVDVPGCLRVYPRKPIEPENLPKERRNRFDQVHKILNTRRSVRILRAYSFGHEHDNKHGTEVRRKWKQIDQGKETQEDIQEAVYPELGVVEIAQAVIQGKSTLVFRLKPENATQESGFICGTVYQPPSGEFTPETSLGIPSSQDTQKKPVPEPVPEPEPTSPPQPDPEPQPKPVLTQEEQEDEDLISGPRTMVVIGTLLLAVPVAGASFLGLAVAGMPLAAALASAAGIGVIGTVALAGANGTIVFPARQRRIDEAIERSEARRRKAAESVRERSPAEKPPPFRPHTKTWSRIKPPESGPRRTRPRDPSDKGRGPAD